MTQTAPRSARRDAPDGADRRHVHVLIIGSGFSGLGAAIRLTQDGRSDFLVVERGSEVGGTWRDNTYPGAACDVPSHLYSYSFELNPNWSRSFSPQSEIQDYLRGVADKYRLADKHLFDTEVTQARWDPPRSRWLVDTTSGTFSADVLVGAVGALAEPQLPAIKGIETFTGELFHSAQWNHDADLAGKRVALIGTGASAIQIGPALVDPPDGRPGVGHLDVYQRTAPWVMPRRDRDYSRVEKTAYQRVPGLQRFAREAIYWGREAFMIGFGYRQELLAAAQKVAEGNITKAIDDPALRAAVTPNWRLGCKRILLSNAWYPMLARDDVDLVTDGIAEIRGNAIVGTDGVEREVDAIVVATGFHVTDSPTFERIVGADGRTLAQVFDAEGMQAYKGASVAGFPNLLFIVGPNTGLGHTSMVYMIESHLNYLSSAMRIVDERGIATFDVKPDVQRAYNRSLQSRMKHTVWSTGGCASWYQDKHGNNTTLWPRFTFAFRRMTRRFDTADYVLTTSRTESASDREAAQS